jgi:hypothetical protein
MAKNTLPSKPKLIVTSNSMKALLTTPLVFKKPKMRRKRHKMRMKKLKGSLRRRWI